MDDLSPRLDRIDAKLDKLSDAISRLARIEERITHQTSGMNRLDQSVEALERRMREVENQSSARGVIIGYTERFGWIAVAALVGIVAYYLKT